MKIDDTFLAVFARQKQKEKPGVLSLSAKCITLLDACKPFLTQYPLEMFLKLNCQLCYPGFEERSRVLTAPYLCRIQIDTSHHIKALKLAPNGVSQSDNTDNQHKS